MNFGRTCGPNHLNYLGDAVIGANVNVGAGAITCNYDGVNKHQTTIGDNVFVGSDSTLVAPVTIESGSYIAAGSSITEDVPSGAMTVTRKSMAGLSSILVVTPPFSNPTTVTTVALPSSHGKVWLERTLKW